MTSFENWGWVCWWNEWVLLIWNFMMLLIWVCCNNATMMFDSKYEYMYDQITYWIVSPSHFIPLHACPPIIISLNPYHPPPPHNQPNLPWLHKSPWGLTPVCVHVAPTTHIFRFDGIARVGGESNDDLRRVLGCVLP